nr:unnamed protein product [Callosobruchus analis]
MVKAAFINKWWHSSQACQAAFVSCLSFVHSCATTIVTKGAYSPKERARANKSERAFCTNDRLVCTGWRANKRLLVRAQKRSRGSRYIKENTCSCSFGVDEISV